MELEELPTILAELANGEIGRVRAFSAKYAEARRAGITFPPVTIVPGAVIAVLAAWQRGAVTPTEVQLWGSCVRWQRPSAWNKAPSEADLVDVLDLRYRSEDEEEAINEVVARLDELGDAVDGEISSDEVKRMIVSLRERQGAQQ
jgi:hypothetical protein